MLDSIVKSLMGPKQAAGRFSPKTPSIEISIPKDHPALPRLYKATMRMPKVTVQQQTGVSYTKDGLLLPGIIEEFFDALAAIIGEDPVNEIEEQLGLHSALSDLSDSAQLSSILPNLLPLVDLVTRLRPTEA